MRYVYNIMRKLTNYAKNYAGPKSKSLAPFLHAHSLALSGTSWHSLIGSIIFTYERVLAIPANSSKCE